VERTLLSAAFGFGLTDPSFHKNQLQESSGQECPLYTGQVTWLCVDSGS
jgi:hypothetical protein